MLHGISSPPRGKSAEYRRDPVTFQEICPPLQRNSELTCEIRHERCSIVVPCLFTHIVTAALHIAQ